MPVLGAITSASKDFFCPSGLEHPTYQPLPHSQHKWLLLYRVPCASAEHRGLERSLPRNARARQEPKPALSGQGWPVIAARSRREAQGTGTLFVPARSRVAFLLLTFLRLEAPTFGGHAKKSKAPRGRNRTFRQEPTQAKSRTGSPPARG